MASPQENKEGNQDEITSQAFDQNGHSVVETVDFEESVKERLVKFVKSFVDRFLKRLTEYSNEVKPGETTQKAGKTADGIAEVSKAANAIPIAGKVVSGLIQKCVKYGGQKNHRKHARKMNATFVSYQKRQDDLRRLLVEASFDIFRCFEIQFIKIIAVDKTWETGIEKLANDAVNRSINYIKNSKNEIEISDSFIIESVIFGHSKKGLITEIMPRALQTYPIMPKPGHTIKSVQYDVKWNTSELYRFIGIVKFENGSERHYTLNKHDNSNKYGFRLPFRWELDLDDKYTFVEIPSEKHEYVVDSLSLDQKQQMKSSIFDQLDGADSQKAVTKTYMEKFKQDIFHALDNTDGRRKCHVVKKNVWFDVREKLKIYTGRVTEQTYVTNYIQNCFVVICGLMGFGKSELALKYVHTNYSQEDSVVWINAKTKETAKDSFQRLAQKLQIKIRDEDGEYKNLKLLAEDAYDCISTDRKRIFIFDDAKNFDTIKEILPLGLSANTEKPHVLISSRNSSEWENDRVNIKKVSLPEFTDAEAMGYVKSFLKIESDLENEDITKLIKQLHNFPLALAKTVTFIKNMNKDYSIRGLKFKVGDCIEKFGQMPVRVPRTTLLYDDYSQTIFQPLEALIDKIKTDEQRGKQAIEILNIMSYFAPSNIPAQLFLKGKPEDDQNKLISSIKLLKKYSLVTLNENHLNMNGLVQQIITNLLEEQKNAIYLKSALEILSEQLKIKKCLSCSNEQSKNQKCLECLNERVDVQNFVNEIMPHIISAWNHAYKNEYMVKNFLMAGFESKDFYTSFFHLIVEGCSFNVIETLLTEIEKSYPKQLDKIINIKSQDRGLPLHIAAFRGNIEIVNLLLGKNAKVNAKKMHSWTALHLAAKMGHLEVVNVLLGKEVNVNAKTGYKFTALHLAIRNGQYDVASALLDRGADINAQTKFKFTPLCLAAHMGHANIVNLLLKNKASVNAQYEGDITALHLAAQHGDKDIVEILVKHGANANAQDIGKFTPLHLAALASHLNVVNTLVMIPELQINARTTKGNTSIHLAAEAGHMEIVKVLIASHAAVDIKNEEGKLASDLAAEKNQFEVRDYILNHLKSKNIEVAGTSKE